MQNMTVEEMKERQHRVPPPDARPGVAHHLPGSFCHVLCVTTDAAVEAGVFRLAEGTMIQAAMGITHQIGTLVAERPVAVVMVTAVQAGHDFDRPLLATNPRPQRHRPTHLWTHWLGRRL